MLIDERGTACLTDCGLSKELGDLSVTQDSAGGTRGYMAPEVSSGSRFSNKADMYSLSIVLFEMLTGNKPDAGADDPCAVLDGRGDTAFVALLRFVVRLHCAPNARPSSLEVCVRARARRTRASARHRPPPPLRSLACARVCLRRNHKQPRAPSSLARGLTRRSAATS